MSHLVRFVSHTTGKVVAVNRDRIVKVELMGSKEGCSVTLTDGEAANVLGTLDEVIEYINSGLGSPPGWKPEMNVER